MNATPSKRTVSQAATNTVAQYLANLHKQLDYHSGVSMQHQLSLKKTQNTIVRIKTDMSLLLKAIEKLDAMTDKSREAFACAHIKRANLEVDFNNWTAVRLEHEAAIKQHGLKMGEVRKQIYAADRARAAELEEQGN